MEWSCLVSTSECVDYCMYELLQSSVLLPNGNYINTYGINAISESGSLICAVEDISTDYLSISTFVNQLNELNVSIHHLYDVILDFIVI